MASDLNQQLENIRAKTRVVGVKYRHLLEAYNEAKQEISSLKAEVLAQKNEIQNLKAQNEYLSIASTVRMTGDDLKATKAMIADLVREIDRCLIDLKE